MLKTQLKDVYNLYLQLYLLVSLVLKTKFRTYNLRKIKP